MKKNLTLKKIFSASLTIILFIGHHATISTIIFILAHRFVRSRILRVYNNCEYFELEKSRKNTLISGVPKSHRVGAIVDADRLDTHCVPQIQVFAVITATTTV